MSNPSANNQIELKPEYAKLGEKGSTRSKDDEEVTSRLLDDVQKGRENKTPTSIKSDMDKPSAKESSLQYEIGDNERSMFKIGAEKITRINSNGSRTEIPYDKYAERLKGESGDISYPKAQISHDAAGQPDHIDFKPNKNH